MSLEYKLRFPLSSQITEAVIKDAAREWIAGSKWYQFTSTNFPPEEKEGTLIQVGNGRTAWFKHFEYRKTAADTEIFYFGYRLETTDQENRKWRAEAVFELNPKQSWMYVTNASYVNNLNKPVQPVGGSRYPRIIRVMMEKGLFSEDNGLVIGQIHRLSRITPTGIKQLRKLMIKQSRLELPILCIHVRGSQDWKNRIGSDTADYLRRTAHVFLCMDEKDDEKWKKLCSDCEWIQDTDQNSGNTEMVKEMSAFELILPQSSVCYRQNFEEKEDDRSLVDQVMDAIMWAHPYQPADTPDWNWLHMQNTVVPQTSDIESYYIYMNEAIASRLQEARRQHHLTQGELAEKAGSTMILISRLERLQTRKVKRDQIHAIEKALGLEKNELARLASGKENHQEKKTDAENRIISRDSAENEDFIQIDMEKGSEDSVNSNKEEDESPTGAGQEAALRQEYSSPRYCHMCGTRLKAESRFCHNCGVRIVTVEKDTFL